MDPIDHDGKPPSFWRNRADQMEAHQRRRRMDIMHERAPHLEYRDKTWCQHIMINEGYRHTVSWDNKEAAKALAKIPKNH
jgi:hypothetical protein